MAIASSKFKKMSTQKQKINKLIEDNMDLKKYICNLIYKPLEGKGIYKPLKNKNIFYKPFHNKCLKKSEVAIFIYPKSGNLAISNNCISEDIYYFNICVPLDSDCWETDKGERADLIAYELATTLENASKDEGLDIEFYAYSEEPHGDMGILSLSARIHSIGKHNDGL